jgi:hypothetical protein
MEEKFTITEIAYRLYRVRGQSAVLQFGKDLELPHAKCEPCEWVSPIQDGACLVCGEANDSPIEVTFSVESLRRTPL